MTLVRFRIRRDTSANWASVNPVLALAEPGLETDTRKVKYGDGSTAWNDLAYASAPVPTLGTLAAQDADDVEITGGELTGLTRLGIGTDEPSTTFAVSNGGAQGIEIDAPTGTIQAFNRSGVAWAPIIVRGSTISLNIAGSIDALMIGTTGIIRVNPPTYASDTAAGSAGLLSGDIYKTSDGAGGFFLKVKA